MTKTINIKKTINLGLKIGLFLFIGIYAFFQTKALNKGVDLTVVGIEDGAILNQDIVYMYGNAKHASVLTVNGQEIPINEDNDFKQELLLSPGYNIITVEATDRFSKKTKKIYRVMYES